jgi:predicted AlkP superfamily pyrophosphatase or phosphodiesterase
MRHFIIFFGFLLVLRLAAAQSSPRVIVLGFDGLSGWAISRIAPPHMQQLREKGAYTLQAKAVLPTTSSPNWASMIMGASPNEHLITSNKWKLSHIKRKRFCGNEKGKIFPTIFRVMRSQKPDAKIYCVHHWQGFARLTDQDALNEIIHTKDEFTTADRAIKIIQEKQPDLLFLHFDHCDHAGHEYGHDTPEYFNAVKMADSLVNVIIKATQAAGTYQDTYFILTSDHGGIGKGHGGNHPREVQIPWIICGPAIKQNYQLPAGRVNQYDTAATIAYILGLRPPDCWIGQPVLDAFKQ